MAKLPVDYEVTQEQTKSTAKNTPNKDFVQFFPKMASGDELIVRFPYASADEVDVRTVHNIKSGNRYITVDCARLENESFEKCPLCSQPLITDPKTGKRKMTYPVKKRGFIKMIYYDTVKDGSILPLATVWNCAEEYATQIKSYIKEYGNLSTRVFKLKRRGTGLDTTYDLIPANQEFYTSAMYPIDFHAFEKFNISPWFLLEASVDDLNKFLTTGTFPQFEPKVAMPSDAETMPQATATPGLNIYDQASTALDSRLAVSEGDITASPVMVDSNIYSDELPFGATPMFDPSTIQAVPSPVDVQPRRQ